MIKGSRRDGSIGDISVLEGGMSNGMGGEPGAKAYEERQAAQASAIMAGDHMNEMLAEGKALAAADTDNGNVEMVAPQGATQAQLNLQFPTFSGTDLQKVEQAIKDAKTAVAEPIGETNGFRATL